MATSEFKQYETPTPKFDAFDPEAAKKSALGSERGREVKEGGTLQSNNYVSGSTGWRLTPDSAELNVSTVVNSLDIPDTTTANSMHVESDGDTYWGVNVASGFSAALASISKAGAAIFKSIQIGGATLQYTVTNQGVFNFGDGSDGAATFSDQGTAPTGTTKTDNTAGATIFRLDRDVYYTTITVNATVTLQTNGYRIFANTSCTVNGTIDRNGNAGGSGGNGGNASADTGGTAGSAGSAGGALADGYLKGSLVGKTGGAGAAGGIDDVGDNGSAGTAGSNTTNSIGSSGVAGGNGGTSVDGIGGSGGGGGTATASNVKLIANWHLATLLDVSSTGSTVKFDNSASSGSGGGGAAGGVNVAGTGAAGGGGGGGGSGSSGGILAIYAKEITVGAAGVIRANGGNGGNGGNAGSMFQGTTTSGNGSSGGGGGGGGNGGQVILVYNILTNSGTISASAGTGGTGGTAVNGFGGGSNGQAGVNGTNGAAGNLRQFQVSL